MASSVSDSLIEAAVLRANCAQLRVISQLQASKEAPTELARVADLRWAAAAAASGACGHFSCAFVVPANAMLGWT